MFDSFGNERLTKWKQIRDELEQDPTAFQTVVDLWARAPFVSPFLDPNQPTSWPDPWHLILDNRYDDLALCLGIMYTLQLTQRFMGSKYEIHMSINSQKKEPLYFLVVDQKTVLNHCYKTVSDISAIKSIESNIIWSV